MALNSTRIQILFEGLEGEIGKKGHCPIVLPEASLTPSMPFALVQKCELAKGIGSQVEVIWITEV